MKQTYIESVVHMDQTADVLAWMTRSVSLDSMVCDVLLVSTGAQIFRVTL